MDNESYVKHIKTDQAVVIGDIHGDAKKLTSLIKQIRSKYSTASLFSTGDLIDRGHGSKEVVDLCIQENIIPVMGNHDYWMVKLLSGYGFDNVFDSIWGIAPTLKSYGYIGHISWEDRCHIQEHLLKNVPYAHQEFFLKTMLFAIKLSIQDSVYWITHCGVENHACECAYKTGDETDIELLNNVILENPWIVYFNFPTLSLTGLHKFNEGIQIFGHQIVKDVRVTDHWIALDTGCGTCPPYKLSAIALPSQEIFQI